MAGRATAKNVQRAIEGPDFDAALAIINGRVASAKSAQSKASGDASQAWGDVEKLGVNKRGAQMFAKVAAIEDDDEQQDMLRTFLKLCQLEGIEIKQDLVDLAQGESGDPVPVVKAPEPKVKAAKKTDTPPPAPEGDTDLSDGAEPTGSEKRAAGAPENVTDISAHLSRVQGSMANARKHLGGKPAPDALS